MVPDSADPSSGNDDSRIDGAGLFDEIDEFLGRYVIYPSDYARHSHTLWCAHTHLMEAWESTPRLHFKSPEWGSGKTRALEACEHIIHRGFIALNMSPAYLIRKLGSDVQNHPTILFDEVDTIFGPKAKEHEDIRGVINAGHRNGAVTGRCVASGNRVCQGHRSIQTGELPEHQVRRMMIADHLAFGALERLRPRDADAMRALATQFQLTALDTLSREQAPEH